MWPKKYIDHHIQQRANLATLGDSLHLYVHSILL